jgi:hypothetical protein
MANGDNIVDGEQEFVYWWRSFRTRQNGRKRDIISVLVRFLFHPLPT